MRIVKKVYDGIRMHCRAYRNQESCGYIFGNATIKDLIQGKNLDESPVSYTIDPDTTLKSVFRKDFAGVYHSHFGDPTPSGIDESKKKYPNKLYLIYSISQDILKAYKWDGKQFSEENVEVV